jgi:hypothetical protein
MNNINEIITYLEALAQELARQSVRKTYHILLAGGGALIAYGHRRSTDDIDFASVQPSGRPRPNQMFQAELVREEIATRGSKSGAFAQARDAVGRAYRLPADWLNDEAANYMYSDAGQPDLYLWQVFSNVLFVYLPAQEYLYALKIMAGRPKDRDDLKQLESDLGIATRDQAQAILDRYVSQEGQQFYEVSKRLKRRFR